MLRNADKTKISYYKQEFASRTEKKAEKTNSADSKHNTFHPWKKLPARLQKHTLTSFGGFHDLFYFSRTSKENSQTANEILLKRVFPSHKISKDTADKKIDFANELKIAREKEQDSAVYELSGNKRQLTFREKKLLIYFKDGRLTDIQKEEVTLAELFNVQDGNDIGLIVWAAKKGHQSLLDYFYREILMRFPADADIQCETIWGTSLLYWAAALNQVEVVRTLLSTDQLQPNKKFQHDETALWIAAYVGNPQVVQLLIDNKADVNVVNKNGMSALAVAAKLGHLAVAECLLEHHAQIDTACNKYKSTPLISAVDKNHIAMIELLLMHKAAINKTNAFNSTPLIYAAWNNHFEAIDILLRNGADLKLKDSNNKTALDIASCPRVRKLLLDAEKCEPTSTQSPSPRG